MNRPTGWRPTAYYLPLGWQQAFTAAAQLDEAGTPLQTVESPIESTGMLLEGPWELVSYDDKFGNAQYRRPANWADIATEGAFQLAGGPDSVGAVRLAGYNVDQVSIGRWRLRTSDGAEVMGIIHLVEDAYIGTSENGTPEEPLRTGALPSLLAACEALDQLW